MRATRLRTAFLALLFAACTSSTDDGDTTAKDSAGSDIPGVTDTGSDAPAKDTTGATDTPQPPGGDGPWAFKLGSLDVTLTGLDCRWQMGSNGELMKLLFGTSPTPPYAGVDVQAPQFQVGTDYSKLGEISAKFIPLPLMPFTGNQDGDVVVRFNEFVRDGQGYPWSAVSGTIEVVQLWSGSQKVTMTPSTIPFTCRCNDTNVQGCKK